MSSKIFFESKMMEDDMSNDLRLIREVDGGDAIYFILRKITSGNGLLWLYVLVEEGDSFDEDVSEKLFKKEEDRLFVAEYKPFKGKIDRSVFSVSHVKWGSLFFHGKMRKYIPKKLS